MRNLLFAGAIALAISACQQSPGQTVEPPADVTALEAEKAAADAAIIADREAAPQAPEPTVREPRWHFVRNDRYREYHLVQQAGPAIPGREFEEGMMCRNVFEATEENMWALNHLVVTSTGPEMTGFMGMIGDQAVVVTLIKDVDRNAPTHLMVGSSIIGSCEESLG